MDKTRSAAVLDQTENREEVPNGGPETETKMIQWHPAFCSAVRLELRANKADLEYENEYNLSRKPLQVDLLVIKKADDVTVENDIGKIFRHDNIMEYKSPEDGLNINDYFKVLSYACLYKADGVTLEEVKSDDVTVSFLREAKPVKLMRALERQGMAPEEYAPGIYYVANAWFPMQIIVISELNPQEHRWIRALTKTLSRDEAKSLLRGAVEFQGTEEAELIDSVMTVSMAANEELFHYFKEVSGMYQFVKELITEDFVKRLIEDEVEAAEVKVSSKEKTATAKRMLKDGDLSYNKIALYSGLPIEEVERLAKELVSDLQLA